MKHLSVVRAAAVVVAVVDGGGGDVGGGVRLSEALIYFDRVKPPELLLTPTSIRYQHQTQHTSSFVCSATTA